MRAGFTVAGLVLAGVGVLAGCGAARSGVSCARPSGFALSLASDTGGQASPVAAAAWFAAHGGVAGLPAGGWRVPWQGTRAAGVRSGSVTLHVVRGADGTWQVDSGTRCP